MEQILIEDNPHWFNNNAYDRFVNRDILDTALNFLKTKHIIALVGARRVGKSTLAKLMIRELIKSVEPKNIFFINLEKPEFIEYKNDATYLNKIYEEYLKLANPNLNNKIYFFIDEIQVFKNWEYFIKSKYENSNIKFVITSTYSNLLESNYASALAGRVLKVRVNTFSFKEFLQYKGVEFKSLLDRAKNKIEIKRLLDEYIKWGGYFDVFSIDDTYTKREILKNIAEDIILKDIVPRYKIKNSQEIRDLFFYLASNATTLLNYTKLANKIDIDAKSVREYIKYFEDNFLITTISSYHTKVANQIKSAKKVYLNDNGFINLGVNRSQNLGIRLENLVFLKLSRSCDDLTYFKDNKEIDFICNNSCYQVTLNLSNDRVLKREMSSFDEFDCRDKVLITLEDKQEIDDIEVIDLSSFLLNKM